MSWISSLRPCDFPVQRWLKLSLEFQNLNSLTGSASRTRNKVFRRDRSCVSLGASPVTLCETAEEQNANRDAREPSKQPKKGNRASTDAVSEGRFWILAPSELKETSLQLHSNTSRKGRKKESQMVRCFKRRNLNGKRSLITIRWQRSKDIVIGGKRNASVPPTTCELQRAIS